MYKRKAYMQKVSVMGEASAGLFGSQCSCDRRLPYLKLLDGDVLSRLCLKLFRGTLVNFDYGLKVNPRSPTVTYMSR